MSINRSCGAVTEKAAACLSRLRALPPTLNATSLRYCMRKLGALSVRKASRQGLVPVTYVLHPDRDRKMLVGVVQDMAAGNIACALVARMFPRNALSQKQRQGLGNVFGVEVWRALHRAPPPRPWPPLLTGIKR